MTIKQKVKNRYGFTLAETLLAVLIMLLVSVIVANGIPVAKNVYEKVVLSANAQSLLSTAISRLRDELGTAWDVEVAADGQSITYYSATTGGRSKVSLDATKGIMLTESVSLTDYNLNTFDGSVQAQPLVSQKASNGNLTISYTGIARDVNDNHVIVITGLNVKSENDTVLAKQDALKIRVFSTPASVGSGGESNTNNGLSQDNGDGEGADNGENG